jgi:peptidoglycan-associated lipoprotein
MLKKYKGKVKLEGHCDERGSDEYNLALGENRAKAALNYLVALGVPPEQLSIISYGKEKPLDNGHTEEAWAKNRRVEFTPVK